MFEIRKATKKKAKLRLALTGVSGSGKTLGAIRIAAGMGGKFVLIDTEGKSADVYADEAEFDVLPLSKPYTPDRYIKAIQMCEAAGYDIIIIDSLSHAWAGEGGVLDMQDIATQASKSKNSYMAWKEVTPWQNKLVNAIVQSEKHIIATMRSKTQHEVINDGGKMRPVKIGLAPIQREGMDYEFTIVLDMDKDSHLYSSSKDRTRLFEGKHEKLSVETGKLLLEWLNSGEEPESKKVVDEDEVNEFKLKISQATLDELNDEYKKARAKYPELVNDFTKIASERKQYLMETH